MLPPPDALTLLHRQLRCFGLGMHSETLFPLTEVLWDALTPEQKAALLQSEGWRDIAGSVAEAHAELQQRIADLRSGKVPLEPDTPQQAAFREWLEGARKEFDLFDPEPKE